MKERKNAEISNSVIGAGDQIVGCADARWPLFLSSPSTAWDLWLFRSEAIDMTQEYQVPIEGAYVWLHTETPSTRLSATIPRYVGYIHEVCAHIFSKP